MKEKFASRRLNKLHNLCCFRLSLLFFGLLISYSSIAQIKITGSAKDDKGYAIKEAAVTLRNKNGYIVSFAYTNLKGDYTIVFPDTIRIANYFLELNILGYQKNRLELKKNVFVYDFLLYEESIALKEVEVKAKPKIILKGDTVRYNVGLFSRAEDRSIGDVLRRLPGISIAENGQISYNGKVISNLFIEDDDLMDGRYGLATKVINKNIIKSIDIIQNHQPIKVLQDKVFTDNVAINLRLQDENSFDLGGQATLGGGLPKQYDMTFDGMLFNKVFKMINSVKTNNSGVDYQNELEQLGAVLGAGDGGNALPTSLLSTGTVKNPDLPKSNYYFNNSFLLNSNNLYNFKRGLQIKSNIQLFLDKNTMSFNSNFTGYLPNDTISFVEQQNSIYRPQQFKLALSATKNNERYFLINRLSLNFGGNLSSSSLDFNNNSFHQFLRDNSRQFTNDFRFIPSLKNRDVMDFRWFITYFDQPQTLNIDTGLNANILNNNVLFSSLSQFSRTPTLLSSATISYRVLNVGVIKHNYQLGMDLERQKLYSKLHLTQLNGIIDAYAGDQGNALSWSRNRFFANAEYTIKKDNWNARLFLPFSPQFIKYGQQEYQLHTEKWQLLINPSINFRFNFNPENYVLLNYDYQNQIGNINSIYRGAILANFRVFASNNAALQQRNIQTTSVHYNFQRSIVMLFINATLSHKNIEVNSILSNTLTNNLQQTVLLPFRNKQDVLSADFGMSKYIVALATTLKMGGNWSKIRYDQFVNQIRLPFNNYFTSINLDLETKPFSYISLRYQVLGNLNKTSPVTTSDFELINTAWRLEQGFTLGFTLVNNLNVNIETRGVHLTQDGKNSLNYLFINSKVRYKLAKLRTDLSFDIDNFMNVQNYQIFNLSSNQSFVNNFDLRGRMMMFRATFLL